MFKALLEDGQRLRASLQIPTIQDIADDSTQSEEELWEYLLLISRATFRKDKKLRALGYLAFNISMSYFLGLGCTVDERAAIDWLYIAASYGDGSRDSLYMFCPLEQSVKNPPKNPVPRKLWAALSVLAGSASNSACLKDLDPSLYNSTTRIIRRHFWGRLELRAVHVEPYLDSIITPIKQNTAVVDSAVEACQDAEDIGETALHICAAIGDMELTRFLVLDAKANINAANHRIETPIVYAVRAGHCDIAKFLYEQGAVVNQISTEKMAITHYLALMDDEDGTRLAPLFVERGARLDLVADQGPEDRDERLNLGAGIPLAWAALKNKPLLFESFLKLHARYGCLISPSDYYVLLQMLATFHLDAMLTLAVESYSSIVDITLGVSDTANVTSMKTKPEVELQVVGQGDLINDLPSDSDFTELGTREYSRILYQALDSIPKVLLGRRYILRKDFRAAKERTLRILLELGADPVLPLSSESRQESGLSLSVFTGDSLAFCLFISHMECRGVDVLSILSDTARFRKQSALQCAIHYNAKDIFFFLLDKYPELISLMNERGRGPLHSAATQEWPGYAEELLARGASPYGQAIDRSTPFTWALLMNPNAERAKEIAEMIAQRADQDEEIEKLLGQDSITGFTAFAKLLSGLMSYKLDIGVDRLEYLVKRYDEPPFHVHISGTTVFQSLFSQQPSLTDRDAIALQCTVLKLLLKTFPDKVNFVHAKSGMTALHMAAQCANLEAIEILLNHGADARLEMSKPGGLMGYTAMGLVILRQRLDMPRWIVQGGQREMEVFEENLRKIIQVLAAAGSEDAGSGANTGDHWRVKIALGQFKGSVNVSVIGRKECPYPKVNH